ncbi:MAG TPA: insulinase family protein, partial [Blastocatellia bacterium]|nr:insulinase family protein [Blastocatellia bacterium]
MHRSFRSSVIILFVCLSIQLSFVPFGYAQATKSTLSLDQLKEGQVVSGFKTAALYLNDADKPMGGRFIHVNSGFTLDFLQIESVPQAMVWVNTLVVSDRGEPHTQEHLLVAKGNKGRELAGFESMSLVTENAFTQQTRTFYDFNTTAGPDTFYRMMNKMLDALLHPDYTDDEVKREVRNFGVTTDADGKTLRLEEKGSVYNEMTSSFINPYTVIYYALNRAQYGTNHPLSFSAGGTPEAIRQIKPENIKSFHDKNYHLGNMGAVASFPKEMPLDSVLSKMNEMLNQLEPNQPKTHFETLDELPPPQAMSPGKISIVTYPNQNEQQPSPVVFGWPAVLKLNHEDQDILNLFIENIAGDATTNLYKKLIDTKTREMNIGAQGIYGYDSADEGNPVFIGLYDVPPANITEEKIAELRAKIVSEISRIAALDDDSPELAEFNARLQNRIIQDRRQLSKFVNSPPRFGARNTGSDWVDHLYQLNKISGFRKSVTLKPELNEIEKQLSVKKNIWRDYIARWQLTTNLPYAVGAKPSPEQVRKEAEDRKARSDAEVARLETVYKVSDPQEAIKKYQYDYNAVSAVLDKASEGKSGYHFINDPPMTLDSALNFKVSKLPGDIPMVASTFDSMTSSTVGLALRLNEIPENEMVYLSVLPTLMTETGVIIDGKPISYEDMSERTRKEILSLNAYYSTSIRTGRAELVVRGSGNDVSESKKAIEWMKLVLMHPNWKPDNLARIRDVIDQSLSGLRNTMQQAEESWVRNPSNAYRRQDSPLLLSTTSFLTEEHNFHRLRWMLKDVGTNETRNDVAAFFDKLSGAQGNRAELKTLLAALQGQQDQATKLSDGLKPYYENADQLSTAAKPIIADAAKEMTLMLGESPDSSLAQDWSYLFKEMRHDVLLTPEKTLVNLDTVRERLLKSGNARMFMIASQSSQQQLDSDIKGLVGSLSSEKSTPATYPQQRVIDARLRGRLPEAVSPVYVGLINPNAQGGVFINNAPLVTFKNSDRESILQLVASKLYGGGGGHAVFSKTIAA